MHKEQLSSVNDQSLLHAKNASEIVEILKAAYVPNKSICNSEGSQIYFGPAVLGKDERMSQEMLDMEFNI